MRRQSYNIPNQVHFLTFSCYRRCQILTDDATCQLLADSINAAREKCDFELWSYVFMPDHVHLLIRPRSEFYSIAYILKYIKGPFGRRLVNHWRQSNSHRLKRIKVNTPSGPTFRVWQRGGGFDRNLYSEDLIRRALNYIEWNPVRKGIVKDPINWKWSSARARAGIVEVSLRIDEIGLCQLQ